LEAFAREAAEIEAARFVVFDAGDRAGAGFTGDGERFGGGAVGVVGGAGGGFRGAFGGEERVGGCARFLVFGVERLDFSVEGGGASGDRGQVGGQCRFARVHGGDALGGFTGAGAPASGVGLGCGQAFAVGGDSAV
jgi:hypothetical protein